jgi:hypothetical protein
MFLPASMTYAVEKSRVPVSASTDHFSDLLPFYGLALTLATQNKELRHL